MVFKFLKGKNKNGTEEILKVNEKKNVSKRHNKRKVTGSRRGEKDIDSEAARSASKEEKKKKRKSRKRRSEFSTPLGTIAEANDELEGQATGQTAKTESSAGTLSMPSISVLDSGNGETEMVMGQVPEDLKRQLFAHEKQEPIEEEPFDAEHAIRKEDPHILEVMRSELNDGEQREEKEDMKESRYLEDYDDIDEIVVRSKKAEAFDPYKKHLKPATETNVESIAKNLMKALYCNDDTTLIDTMCADLDSNKRKRVYYNDVLAFRFIQEVILDGIPMLYHHPPKNPIDNDWTGQSMTMFVRPGDYRGRSLSQPRLEWRTVDGGWSRFTGASSTLISVGLLDIHSIMDRVEEDEEHGENFCFFSITTKGGDVHVLECADESERDRVVTGIHNLMSQISKSIITGDDTVTKELYASNAEEEGELPLRTYAQSLKSASHDFLDSFESTVQQ